MILATVLYVALSAYQVWFEDITRAFRYRFHKNERRGMRNVIGAVVLAADVLIFIKTLRPLSGRPYLIVLHWAVLALAVVHVIASVLAIFNLQKAYIVCDVVSYFIRLIAAGAVYIMYQLFDKGGMLNFLLSAGMLGFTAFRGMRMLDHGNGEWMELRLEDMGPEPDPLDNIGVR